MLIGRHIFKEGLDISLVNEHEACIEWWDEEVNSPSTMDIRITNIEGQHNTKWITQDLNSFKYIRHEIGTS